MKQSLRSPNSDKLVAYLHKLTEALPEYREQVQEKLTATQARIADFEANMDKPFPLGPRLEQLTEMRIVLQALLQDGLTVETIYERYGDSPHIPPDYEDSDELVSAHWSKRLRCGHSRRSRRLGQGRGKKRRTCCNWSGKSRRASRWHWRRREAGVCDWNRLRQKATE